MKPFDINAAKNGAPVCTRDGRKARIICFDREGNTHPIIALIRGDSCETVEQYTNRGRSLLYSQCSLDLFMYEKPEPQFKPFDKVLVKDYEDEEWKASFFSHKTEGCAYCCGGNMWTYCIPFIGNEHLLGTTDNPKE